MSSIIAWVLSAHSTSGTAVLNSLTNLIYSESENIVPNVSIVTSQPTLPLLNEPQQTYVHTGVAEREVQSNQPF